MAAAAFAVVACAEAGVLGTDSGNAPRPDSAVGGGFDARPDAPPPPPPDAAPPVAVSLSHSTADTIIAANSVSCNNGDPTFHHTDNSYWRVFNLTSLGVTGALTITSVDMGIEEALADSGGTQSATLRLHTLAGTFTLANLTLAGSVPTTVPDQTLAIMNIPVPGVTIPAGSILVVEFFTPDGPPAMNRLFVGSNNSGETDPTYISAPGATACNIDEPATATSLGFPDMHMVLKVNGTYLP